MEQVFQRERILIGEGRMAKVYRWNGFAYKCFKKEYPDEWIIYERKIQTIVNKMGLPTVEYFPSEFEHSIKMEYIDGISLAERIRDQKYEKGLEDLFTIFGEVHKKKGTDLPCLTSCLAREIEKVQIASSKKERALQYISELPEGDSLCHMDFHFLNIMYADDGYHIIDWINAKSGNPIYDFARSYIIMYEFADRFAEKYLEMVKVQGVVGQEEFSKAIYVMAVHLLSEYNSDKIRQLISKMDGIE